MPLHTASSDFPRADLAPMLMPTVTGAPLNMQLLHALADRRSKSPDFQLPDTTFLGPATLQPMDPPSVSLSTPLPSTSPRDRQGAGGRATFAGTPDYKPILSGGGLLQRLGRAISRPSTGGANDLNETDLEHMIYPAESDKPNFAANSPMWDFLDGMGAGMVEREIPQQDYDAAHAYFPGGTPLDDPTSLMSKMYRQLAGRGRRGDVIHDVVGSPWAQET